MANPEHVAIAEQGAEVFNQWREENPDVSPNLSHAVLSHANLGWANLSHANLSHAVLSYAFLSWADLSWADLSWANFSHANLSHAVLSHAVLSHANLSRANFSHANFSEANLSHAVLSEANLSEANLSEANLSEAFLWVTQALRTSFDRATLTGACVKDWHINSQTNLNNVECEYIFLDFDRVDHKYEYSERRPSSGSFGAGDFTKLVQKSISTVDLIFRNGINWEAFAHSFRKLRIQAGSAELDIQAIENKGDGDFVIRVHAPSGTDKAKIQEFVMEEYGTALKAIETQYRIQLQAKDDQIMQYRQENTNLWEMAKLMANRPIDVEARAATEAAHKIQQLLAQFQGQDVSADVAQDEAAKQLAEQAQKDPTLMGKLVGWSKQLTGDAAKGATGEAAKVVGSEAGKVVIKALALLGLSLI